MAQPGVENASPARSSWKAPPNSNSNSPTPDSRPSSSSAPVRPVTARTWQALNGGSSSPTSSGGEAPKRVSIYTNDLYSPPFDDRPRSPSARPVTPRSAERLQQQLVKSSPGRAASPLHATPSRLQMSTTNVPALALPRASPVASPAPVRDSLDSLLARAAKAVAEDSQQARQQAAAAPAAESAATEAPAPASAQADSPTPAAPAQLQRPTTAPVRSATINIAALAGARAGGAASPSSTLGAVRGGPRTMQTAVFQNFAGSSPASPRTSTAGGPSSAGRSPLSGARPSTPSFQPVATPRPGTAMADFNIKSSKYPGQGATEAAGEDEGATAGASSHALPRRPYPVPPSTAPAKADIKAGQVAKKDKLAGFGIISGAFVAVRGGGSGGRRGSAEGVEEALDKAALKAMQHADMLAEAELSSKAGLRKFLLMPGPTDKPLRCKIFRTKSGLMKSHSQYVLMLEDSETILLAGRKRKSGAQGSEYTISVDKNDLAHRGPNFFGKLRSNFIGTEFVCYDDAEKPRAGDNFVNARGELAAVSYQTNVLGTKGPRKMTVLVPKLDPFTGCPLKLAPRGANDSMLARYKAYDLKDTVVLRNKPPKWNDALGAYCLNFGGRVTQASVKNFQLVSVDNMERIILQFGKIGSDTFTMDYAYPMTAMQAFAICLSSFDSKLACE